MNSVAIDSQLSSAILNTLQGALSPDKALIDQAQLQLKVLQVRQGKIYLYTF
jgi:hypothetical protein